jgi:hypothetical protein
VMVLFSLVVTGPLIGYIAYVLILLVTNPAYLLLPAGTIGLLLVSLIWAVIAFLRFGLMPLVGLFEPEVPVRKTLSRSKFLLMKGGQWFLVKGMLVMLFIYIVLAAATNSSVQELSNSNNIAIQVVLGVFGLLAEAVLVLLYRNRRAVKDGESQVPTAHLSAMGATALQ